MFAQVLDVITHERLCITCVSMNDKLPKSIEQFRSQTQNYLLY